MIAPEKVIFPAPAPVFKEIFPVKLMGDAKLIASFVVVIDPPVDTLPVPVWENAPSRLNATPFAIDSVAAPVKASESGPVPAVVIPALIAYWFALREIPDAPLVETAPPSVTRPKIFDPLIEAEANVELVVMFVALLIVTAPRAELFPTAA